jgi:peroxiredoxin
MDHRGITRIFVATIFLLAIPQAGQAELGELLEKLNLSTYPRVTKSPEFNAQTTDGRTVSLASQRGKVVLVNFWASWCQECRPEMPMFEQLHRQFAAQGLSVIGINAREGTAAIRGYANELRLTFPLVLDIKGEINAAYGVVGLPATFIIGRDGRAVARAVGPREWSSAPARNLVQELLAESAAVKKSNERSH